MTSAADHSTESNRETKIKKSSTFNAVIKSSFTPNNWFAYYHFYVYFGSMKCAEGVLSFLKRELDQNFS